MTNSYRDAIEALEALSCSRHASVFFACSSRLVGEKDQSGNAGSGEHEQAVADLRGFQFGA